MAKSDDQLDTDDEPILDLATLVERPHIKIDGDLHEILSADELSVLDCQRFASWGRRIDTIMAKDELSEADEAELDKITTQLSDQIMIGVPAKVRAKLTGAQRFLVLEFFFVRSLRWRLGIMAAARSIGGTSSRGFNGFTAVTPVGGSNARRSRSSGPTS